MLLTIYNRQIMKPFYSHRSFVFLKQKLDCLNNGCMKLPYYCVLTSFYIISYSIPIDSMFDVSICFTFVNFKNFLFLTIARQITNWVPYNFGKCIELARVKISPFSSNWLKAFQIPNKNNVQFILMTFINDASVLAYLGRHKECERKGVSQNERLFFIKIVH